VLRGVAPSAHKELSYRRNLRLLAAAPGLQLIVIGRIALTRPQTLFLLAVGGDGLQLPEEWNGRVNLGLDTLQTAHVHRSSTSMRIETRLSRPANHEAYDPLDPLERRLRQVLLGGRSALSESTWSGFARDEARLSRNQLPTAAQLLHELRLAPLSEGDASAQRTRLARAWLAGRTYVSAADARLQRLAWLDR
jgi:hypothetical protein